MGGGSKECSLIHSTVDGPRPCGPGSPFTVTTGTGFGMNATSFTSTLTANATPALDDTLVECFGPGLARDAANTVGKNMFQILSQHLCLLAIIYASVVCINILKYCVSLVIRLVLVSLLLLSTVLQTGAAFAVDLCKLEFVPSGPPSVPTLSCVHVTEDGSGAVNVTVNWTLSDGDSADFYLINITYGGLLNITTSSVTQHELTGFMAGYEYNITVRGVNCGSQEGGESEPLRIFPQGRSYFC